MPTPPATDHILLQEAIEDSRQDLDEILYLLNDCTNRLKTFLRDIRRAKLHILSATYQETVITTEQYLDIYHLHTQQVANCLNKLAHISPTMTLLRQAEEIIEKDRDFLRSYQARIGTLITSTDWQSPSFAHSIRSQAGRQTNTIYATINDYKRDQHWDAYRYERVFLKEYIDALVKFPVQVLATSSGMAAFTTILNFLLLEHKAIRPVLIGKSIYFQNKILLNAAYGDKIIEVDESDTDAVLSAIQTHNPSIIILDSLTNMPNIALPNINGITEYLIKHARDETYLIIDNTGLSVAFQPLPLFIGRLTKVRLIVFESLNKYYQFGMDRVTGGILWNYGGDTGKLFDYRVHSGTNIPDVSVDSLPTPNRKLLTLRLTRHQRNALFLATHLQEWIDSHQAYPFTKIVYPGLSNHPNYQLKKGKVFYGSYLSIQFKKKYQNVTAYKRFVSSVMDEAKRQHVHLISGTSFGLNTTRIYLTALRSKPSTPFVRIALGTEHRILLEAITEVFVDAFSHFH